MINELTDLTVPLLREAMANLSQTLKANRMQGGLYFKVPPESEIAPSYFLFQIAEAVGKPQALAKLKREYFLRAMSLMQVSLRKRLAQSKLRVARDLLSTRMEEAKALACASGAQSPGPNLKTRIVLALQDAAALDKKSAQSIEVDSAVYKGQIRQAAIELEAAFHKLACYADQDLSAATFDNNGWLDRDCAEGEEVSKFLFNFLDPIHFGKSFPDLPSAGTALVDQLAELEAAYCKAVNASKLVRYAIPYYNHSAKVFYDLVREMVRDDGKQAVGNETFALEAADHEISLRHYIQVRAELELCIGQVKDLHWRTSLALNSAVAETRALLSAQGTDASKSRAAKVENLLKGQACMHNCLAVALHLKTLADKIKDLIEPASEDRTRGEESRYLENALAALCKKQVE